jgi:DNA polymerase-4
VGNGTTFSKNLTTRDEVHSGIAMLADSVATRLRHHGLYAGGIQVTIRDPEFRDRSRQIQLTTPTHLIRDLTQISMDLLDTLWTPPTPIRALTVTAINLSQEGEAFEHVDLFSADSTPKKERLEKLEAAMDRIRGKYGTDAISFGSLHHEKEEDPLP